jgi:class 3 adenylate cyclase
VPSQKQPDPATLQRPIKDIERLIEDVNARAESLGRTALLPDLERCALAAARATDCVASVDKDRESHLLHDLRNHLGAVLGYSELLIEDYGGCVEIELLDALGDLKRKLTEVLAAIAGEALLPVTASPSTAAAPEPEPGTLLVIDDSEQSRELLSRYLLRQGHKVLTAASGPEGMEVLRRMPIDLVFLDLVMPEMSGLEVLAELKADPVLRAVPVIIVSGIQDTDGVIRCIEAGAEDYIYKPFNATLLRARLNAGLQRKRWHDREEAYRRELERSQRFIRNTFGRYLSDEIVDALLENPQGLNLGGSTSRVTILMSDIRNFSPICEQHDPGEVVQLLNNYLGVMSEIIMANHGTVDEFIGDGILAIFGAPVSRPDDALRAVACALQMQRAVDGINRQNAELGLPSISIGIGLNTGVVVAGNIGSERRSKYGVVGHTVNLTARIESYTSAGEILAAQSTIDAVGDRVETGRTFTARPKGMAEAVTVYAIRALRSGRDEAAGDSPGGVEAGSDD